MSAMFLKTRRWPEMRLAMAALVAVCWIGTHPARAKGPETLACVWLNNPGAFTAFGRAYESFLADWLVIGEDWFQAYEIGGSAKHPLLGTPMGDMGSVKGFVWARDVRCETWPVAKARLARINARRAMAAKASGKPATAASEVWGARLVAKTVTFSEEGNDWTPPLRDGTLWEVFLAKEGETWVVEDNTVDASILSAGAKERRPEPGELPRRTTPRAWR